MDYIKTGRYTADGEVFHYANTNVRIGTKHYDNATESTLKNLGLFENLKQYVTESEYENALQTESDDELPYSPCWKEIDGEKYWITYEIIPNAN